MPRQQLMSWEGAPNFRWVKMHRGVRYRVTCEELGSSIRTKEATINLANAWWLNKKRELDGAPPQAEPDSQIVSLLAELDGPDPVVTAMVEAFVEPTPRGKAKLNERSVKACGQAFLEIVRDQVRPMSYREIKWFIEKLPNQDADVALFDETFIDRKYLELRKSGLSDARRKKLWGFFKRFIKFLWERRLIDMPRNLDSHAFTTRPQKIEIYTPEEVRKVLKSRKPRQRLYALLALNCGCNNVDSATLKKNQVDLEKGTLTRRRVKTGDNPNVPVVVYKLWTETLRLLKKYWSEHPELVLTSKDNTPLWTASVEGDRTPRKDLILKQ